MSTDDFEKMLQANYCPECKHPWSYHSEEGCSMPVTPGTNMPVMSNREPRARCDCKRKTYNGYVPPEPSGRRMKISYSHAAPYIRYQLLSAVYTARQATTQRDRNEGMARASGLRSALTIMARSEDQTPVDGIAELETLPPMAMEFTLQWLGDEAELVLGKLADSNNQQGEESK